MPPGVGKSGDNDRLPIRIHANCTRTWLTEKFNDLSRREKKTLYRTRQEIIWWASKAVEARGLGKKASTLQGPILLKPASHRHSPQISSKTKLSVISPFLHIPPTRSNHAIPRADGDGTREFGVSSVWKWGLRKEWWIKNSLFGASRLSCYSYSVPLLPLCPLPFLLRVMTSIYWISFCPKPPIWPNLVVFQTIFISQYQRNFCLPCI